MSENDFNLSNKADRRFKAEHSFEAFCNIYLGEHFSLEPADFHTELADILEDDTEEAVAVIGFRGSAKTTFSSLAYPLWVAVMKKYNFIIITNETKLQMELNIENIRKEIEDNELLQFDFPELRYKTRMTWRNDKLELNGDILILGRSRGQKIRGLKYRHYRPQVIIGDDLEDLEGVRKKENRDKTERWFNAEVVPAQDELKCKMVIIGNLLHNDAFMARLKKRGLYKVLEFPLIDKKGKITWKAKYPTMEAVEKKKAKVHNNATWSREYLLKVISEEDQIIKQEDIVTYNPDILTQKDEAGRNLLTISRAGSGVDLAISEKQTADFTTIVSGYKTMYKTRMRLLIRMNPINKRMDFNTTQLVIGRVNTSMPLGSKIIVEDVGYQKSAIQELKRKGYPVVGVRPVADKTARLEVVAPLIKDGTVMFAEIGNEELIEQLLGFGVEAHDDLVDALVYLIFDMIMSDQKGGHGGVGRIDRL